MSRPIIVGHRGAKGMAPENTLKAFKIGCLSADMVECDIHLSKDGVLVVSHDDDLGRIVGVSGEIKDLTLEQLKRYDFGQGEKIPTLSEVIEIVRQSKKGLIIEIKGNSDEEASQVAGALLELISKSRLPENLYICSFWHSILGLFKSGGISFKTFVLINYERGCDEIVKDVKKSKADGVGIRCEKITGECVKKLHNSGYFINAWVADDKNTFDKMKELKVDWITSDYPKKASEEFKL